MGSRKKATVRRAPRPKAGSGARARPGKKPRPRAARRTAARPASPPRGPAPLSHPYGYEEAVIHAVMRGSGEPLNPNSALFAGALASLTPSLRALHFARGMRAGKTLYAIASRPREYGDAALGLPEFLERVGYSQVSFDRVGGLFRLRMRAPGHADLNANTHTFEAGMISGFMSAAEGRRVMVSETSCSYNGSALCAFEPASHGQGPAELGAAVRGMASGLASGAADRKVINSYYCNLLWDTLLGAEYGAEVRGVVRYCGAAMREALEGLGRDPAREAKTVVEMLGLGKMQVARGRGFSASVAFDPVSARRAFIDVSMSFVDGLLGKSPLSITEAASSYSVSALQ